MPSITPNYALATILPGEIPISPTVDELFSNNFVIIDSLLFGLASGTIGGLSNYFYLPGRVGGQIGYGGTAASNNLTLRSTSNSTKGYVVIGDDGSTVGIGLVPTFSTSALLVNKTGTNKSDIYGEIVTVIPTVTTSGIRIGIGSVVDLTAITIATGISDTSFIAGYYALVLREAASDDGTLDTMYGGVAITGHYTAIGANAVTTNVFGYWVSEYVQKGTITNLYGFYVETGGSGSAVVNSYGVYLAIPSGSSLTYSIFSLNGSVNLTAAAGQSFVWNESGSDADFRIEGDTNSNLLLCDASGDIVLVGTNTAVTGALLTVNGRLSTVSSSTYAAVKIGSIAGDPSTLVNGDVWYNSTTNKFRARENGSSVDMIGSSSGTGVDPFGFYTGF